MINLAAIDIGTNSVRLLISRYSGSCGSGSPGFSTLIRKMKITRIGRNLEKSGNISKKSALDTLEVLSGYIDLINSYNVKKYMAVATSALRKAKNREWFREYILEKLGLEIDIISGKKEARLSFYGAAGGSYTSDRSYYKNDSSYETGPSGKHPEDNLLIIDIGGGSSEFILGKKSTGPVMTESIDLGCVNLTERFISGDVPRERELEDLKKFIRKKIYGTVNKIIPHKPLGITGVAGTITTLAAIDQKMERYDSSRIHNYSLRLAVVKDIFGQLCSLDPDERKKVAGLQPERADIIVCGTAILIEIMEMLGQEKLTVSEQDILDGIIYTLAYFW